MSLQHELAVKRIVHPYPEVPYFSMNSRNVFSIHRNKEEQLRAMDEDLRASWSPEEGQSVLRHNWTNFKALKHESNWCPKEKISGEPKFPEDMYVTINTQRGNSAAKGYLNINLHKYDVDKYGDRVTVGVHEGLRNLVLWLGRLRDFKVCKADQLNKGCRFIRPATLSLKLMTMGGVRTNYILPGMFTHPDIYVVNLDGLEVFPESPYFTSEVSWIPYNGALPLNIIEGRLAEAGLV